MTGSTGEGERRVNPGGRGGEVAAGWGACAVPPPWPCALATARRAVPCRSPCVPPCVWRRRPASDAAARAGALPAVRLAGVPAPVRGGLGRPRTPDRAQPSAGPGGRPSRSRSRVRPPFCAPPAVLPAAGPPRGRWGRAGAGPGLRGERSHPPRASGRCRTHVTSLRRAQVRARRTALFIPLPAPSREGLPPAERAVACVREACAHPPPCSSGTIARRRGRGQRRGQRGRERKVVRRGWSWGWVRCWWAVGAGCQWRASTSWVGVKVSGEAVSAAQ